jgi:hypothetical protein
LVTFLWTSKGAVISIATGKELGISEIEILKTNNKRNGIVMKNYRRAKTFAICTDEILVICFFKTSLK